MKRFLRVVVLAAVLGVMVGCEKSEEEKKKNEPPPPPVPTEGEIINEFRQGYQPLADALAAGVVELPQGAGEAVATSVRNTKNKYAAAQNGPTAIPKVAGSLEDLVKEANDKEAWGVVVAACDALAVVNPESSKITRYRERAQLQLNRPKVTITGSSQVHDADHSNAVVFFLDVYLPEKQKTESVKQSVGDEFFGLRFVEIVGNNEGIKFEYKATGDFFTVMRKR